MMSGQGFHRSSHSPVAFINCQRRYYLLSAYNSALLEGQRRFSFNKGRFFLSSKESSAFPFDNCVFSISSYVQLS